MTRSWARRSLAAETIFMALVICWVFFTERIRRRMSIRLGMSGFRQVRDEAGLELFDQLHHPAAQLVVQDFLRGNVGKHLPVGILSEPVQFRFELAADFDWEIVEVALGAREDDQDLLLER